ncbi:hypothetical protein NQZ68_016469 [Dissostichus eleginoides]|nr:hypothetical protein NQZ68_016469 [Dissostichus eleginoides]
MNANSVTMPRKVVTGGEGRQAPSVKKMTLFDAVVQKYKTAAFGPRQDQASPASVRCFLSGCGYGSPTQNLIPRQISLVTAGKCRTGCRTVKTDDLMVGVASETEERVWNGGGGCMSPLQVDCDPLRVRVHSGDTGDDVSFEEVIYNGHLE